jgi:hypothetical protein
MADRTSMVGLATDVWERAGSKRAHFRAIICTMDKRLQTIGLYAVRYGIGAVMVIAGVVLLATSPAGFGVDGFAMAVGGGLSVLLINGLYRLGVSGDREREQEEQARRYLEEHGEWPEDDTEPAGRQWALPAGVVTFEEEQRRSSGAA